MNQRTKAIYDSLFDSSRSLADATSAVLVKTPDLLPDYFELACFGKYPYNMRSANVIEKADDQNKGFAANIISDIIEKLNHFSHPGVRRCFLRMLIRYVPQLNDEDTGKLYDICLLYATDNRQFPAIRHNSIQVLARIGEKYPEIADEVKMALRLRLDEEHGAIKNWLKRYLEN
jgi:hypothetical protein